MKQIKHWQDPLNVLMGAWLVLSPWILRYQDQTTPWINGIVIGLALIAASLGATFMPRAWEDWTEGVLGLWMIVSPWVLAFSMHMDATRNAVASGVVILVLALWVLATDKDYSVGWHKPTAH